MMKYMTIYEDLPTGCLSPRALNTKDRRDVICAHTTVEHFRKEKQNSDSMKMHYITRIKPPSDSVRPSQYGGVERNQNLLE